MNARELLPELVRISGKTAAELSRDMGRADSYLSATMKRGSVPRLDIVAEICEACGCQVVVRDADGGEIVVEAG